MRFFSRLAFNAAVLVASTGLTSIPGMAAEAKVGPVVQAVEASSITPTSAVLLAKVGGENKPATYHFEYGTTTSYGTSTPDAAAPAADHAQRMSAPVTGLLPATTYHLRAVASNSDGTTQGHDVTFVTLPPPPPPVLGKSVVTAPVAGTVLVRVPGAKRPTPLGASRSIPAGSVIDATHGRIELTSALTRGRSQTGIFWGGAFRVRQSRSASGILDLYLVGPRPAICSGAEKSATRSAAISRSRRHRTLWGHDHHGRFRTHGSNSVATVRGTLWATEDTCAGTLTTVREGSVTVRDFHRHRNVIVRAGHHYLARSH